jgi:RNA polymerase sigma-32 factor
MSQARKRLEDLSEKHAEFSEIAESLGVKTEEIMEMETRMGNRDLSLNAVIDEDGDSTHIDFLTYDGEDQETAIIRKEEMAIVQRNIAGALAKLNEKESYIIRNRVMADNPMTLQQVGDHFSITRERARQIEKRALEKMSVAIPHLREEPKLLEE